MQDRVADVLAQRAALDRGAGVAIVFSVLLHGGLTALAVYAALHAPPMQKATMVSIQFAKMPSAATAPVMQKPAARPSTPKIEDVKPKIEAPKKPEKPPEKNTVPLSPFGRSTKKGSETPAPAPPTPSPPSPTPQPPSPGDTVPIGGSGVAALEGGDFPYTLYLQGMHRKIGSNWFRPQVGEGASVVIYFRIQRDGTIVESRVETSSGNPTFDRAALSAVRSSSPLTPLPFGYNGNYLGVHLIFK